MIALPDILITPAKKAGIRTPSSKAVQENTWDKKKFPHFFVYISMQLGRMLPYPSAHWDNAKIIAKIPKDKIMTITPPEVLAMGYK